MTRPSAEIWSSVGRIVSTEQRFSTSNTSPKRFELVSSGQESRKCCCCTFLGKMSRSILPITVENLPSDVLTGYSADGKHAPAWTLYGSAPGGGIHSTAEDLVRYAQALLDGTAPGMVALTPRWDAGYGTRIGYAWNTTTVGGHTVTSHGGATGGFCSAIALDLANDRAVIILSSTKAPVEQAAQTLLVGEH